MNRGPGALTGIVALVSLLAAVSVASASTVVLVRSPNPTPIAAEATVRLRGELVSAGFNVEVTDPPLDGDVRATLEQAAAAPRVDAVVAILGGNGEQSESSAELWVIDRVTRKTVVRRVPSQPDSGRGAEVLSIRALELLRASFLEVALAANHDNAVVTTPPPVEVIRWTDKTLTDALENRWQPTWGVEGGGSVFGNLDGIRPAVMPLIRLQRLLSASALARLTVAGLGTPARLDLPVGTAEVRRQLALLEGGLRFRQDKRLHPFLSAGAGVIHTAATGQSTMPYEGISRARWSMLAGLGAGLHWTFPGRFELAWEVHALYTMPYPVVRFWTEEIATEGRPSLFTTLTLIAWMYP